MKKYVCIFKNKVSDVLRYITKVKMQYFPFNCAFLCKISLPSVFVNVIAGKKISAGMFKF